MEAVERMRKEQEELILTKENLTIDLEVYFHYPLLKSLDCLKDNRAQAIGIARRTED